MSVIINVCPKCRQVNKLPGECTNPIHYEDGAVLTEQMVPLDLAELLYKAAKTYHQEFDHLINRSDYPEQMDLRVALKAYEIATGPGTPSADRPEVKA